MQEEIYEERKQQEEEAARKRRKEQSLKEAKQAVLAEAKELIDQEKHNHSICQNARQGSDCFNHILFAMNHGIFENPSWYPSLSQTSSFRDFQALLHGVSRNECPRPCFDEESGCLDVTNQNTCVLRIQWVRQVELIQHRDWYPDLSPESRDEDIAESLWQRGVHVCHRPCKFGEPEDPNLRTLPPPTQFGKPAPVRTSQTTSRTTTTKLVATIKKSAPSSKPKATTTRHATSTPIQNTLSNLKLRAEEVTTVPPSSTENLHGKTTGPEVTSSQASTSKAASTAEASSTTAEFVFTSTTLAAPQNPARCREQGVSYLPIDIAGLPPTHEPSASECQDHCAKTAGAAYYSFYIPSQTCHCESAEVATRQEDSFGYIGGQTACAKEPQNLETVHILERMEDGCYHVGAYYSPVILELSSYQQDAFQCQEHCRASSECAYFSFFSLDKSCQVSGSHAGRQDMSGAISGPPKCQDALELFLARPQIQSNSMRSSWVVGISMAMFAMLAALLLLKRLEPRPGNHLLSQYLE